MQKNTIFVRAKCKKKYFLVLRNQLPQVLLKAQNLLYWEKWGEVWKIAINFFPFSFFFSFCWNQQPEKQRTPPGQSHWVSASLFRFTSRGNSHGWVVCLKFAANWGSTNVPLVKHISLARMLLDNPIHFPLTSLADFLCILRLNKISKCFPVSFTPGCLVSQKRLKSVFLLGFVGTCSLRLVSFCHFCLLFAVCCLFAYLFAKPENIQFLTHVRQIFSSNSWCQPQNCQMSQNNAFSFTTTVFLVFIGSRNWKLIQFLQHRNGLWSALLFRRYAAGWLQCENRHFQGEHFYWVTKSVRSISQRAVRSAWVKKTTNRAQWRRQRGPRGQEAPWPHNCLSKFSVIIFEMGVIGTVTTAKHGLSSSQERSFWPTNILDQRLVSLDFTEGPILTRTLKIWNSKVSEPVSCLIFFFKETQIQNDTWMTKLIWMVGKQALACLLRCALVSGSAVHVCAGEQTGESTSFCVTGCTEFTLGVQWEKKDLRIFGAARRRWREGRARVVVIYIAALLLFMRRQTPNFHEKEYIKAFFAPKGNTIKQCVLPANWCQTLCTWVWRYFMLSQKKRSLVW